MTIDPGPGRRPDDEPTHPTPTRPVTPPTPPPPPPTPQTGHLPIAARRLDEIVGKAWILGADMLAELKRDFDVASAPSAEDDPAGLGFVEIRLLAAVADVRSALLMCDQIAAHLDPARQDTTSASLPGGPSDHLASAPVGASGACPTTPPGRGAGASLNPPWGDSW